MARARQGSELRWNLVGIAVLGMIFLTISSTLARAQNGTAAPASTGAENSQSPSAGKEAADLSLEELANVQVYSAAKHLQNVSDAPASVTLVTADDIQKFGYRALADILRSAPGFYVTYDRNYSFVGVRGFGRLGDWNSRVLLLVDGHRINDNVFGQAMLGTEFPVDVDLISRVEIVLGPSSSLYGSNAFLAVINVITRKSPDVAGWELSFEPGSFQTYRGRATYGGRYKGAGFMLSGTVYNSEGQTLFVPEFDSPSTHNGIVQNADDEVNEHILATISFRGFTLQGVFSSREKGSPLAYFGTVFGDPRTRNVDHRQYFDLSYQHALRGHWFLDAHTSYDQYRLEAPLATASPNQAGGIGVDRDSARGNWWTGEVKLSRTLWEKHKLTFGAELRDNLRQDQGFFSSAGNTFDQDSDSSRNWGVYAQDDYEISSKLSLSAGVRHDRYPRGTVVDALTGQTPIATVLPSFGGSTNPRFGLIYHPRETTTFKVLYGSAFRAPEVFEATPDVGDLVVDNFALRPETIESFEVDAEQKLGARFKLSGTIFHNRADHLITLQPDSTSGLLLYSNGERVNASGSELALTGRTIGGLQGTASLSLVDADGPHEAKISNSPGEMAKINLSIPLAHKRLSAGVEGQFMGPRRTLAGNRVGSFQVFNLTLLGHSFGKHLDLSASVYNVLDKRYADPARPEDPEDSIWQDGRNFRIKMTFRF